MQARLECEGRGTSVARVAFDEVNTLLVDEGLQHDMPAQAEATFREALAYRETQLDTTHPKVAEARCGLGRALAAQRNWVEAGPLLEANLPVFAKWGLAPQDAVEAARRALLGGGAS